MKIEFIKHARHGGSKDFDVLIKISGSVFAFNLLQSEYKQIMKLLDIVKYAKESDEDFRLRAIIMCDTMSGKMDHCDLEDLAVAQIVSQLGDSVEVHCSRLLALQDHMIRAGDSRRDPQESRKPKIHLFRQ